MTEPVRQIDPRLAAALTVQFAQWRATLRAGATRVGWKLGIGDAERIGDEVAVGHLTSATTLAPGSLYRDGNAAALHADAEIALELSREVEPDVDSATAGKAIAGFGAALEINDLARPPHDPESIVAANVFHRAVAFGPFQLTSPSGVIEARLIINGRVVASALAANDLADRVRAAARVLGAMGERLQAGDRIITGSVVQVAIKAGDQVIADMGALGKVQLSIAP
jgi:2-keto-4-pentenoate hydratase